jgi:hypothetical protein
MDVSFLFPVNCLLFFDIFCLPPSVRRLSFPVRFLGVSRLPNPLTACPLGRLPSGP